MTKFDQQRRGEVLRAVFEVLAEHPDGIQAKDAIAASARRLTLSQYEMDSYASGGRRFDKLLRFTTINAVKAGWMLKVKGTWSATPEGLQAMVDQPHPKGFLRAAEVGYAAWFDSQEAPTSNDEGGADASADEVVSISLEEAEETAFDAIHEHLATMNPYAFQDLVAELLRGMGYAVPHVAQRGKDGGVDLIAFPDPLGTQNPRIKVQVKREQATTDVSGLRAFMSLLTHGDVGVFVTLGGFTRDAQLEARASETRRVTLIDRARLVDMWIAHYDRLSTAAKRLLPLKPVYFLVPDDPEG